MKARRSTRSAWVILLSCMTAALSIGASEEVEFKGLITTRTGDSLTIRTADSKNVIIVLTDDTKVQQPKGLGLRKKQMAATVLMPGLKISVKGVGDQDRATAKSITFSSDDLKTAQMIQAGLTPTQQQVAINKENIASNAKGIEQNKAATQANQERIQANREAIDANQQQTAAATLEIQEAANRFSKLTEFEVKGNTTVNFAPGSAAIPAKGKADLTSLAKDAASLTGYIIEVKGFADSSGNAAMNQKLSMDRAQAVVSYLIQSCKIPVRRIVAPGAMGTADPVANNETTQGRAENRRVEVKVLMNRGLAGQ
jgi:OmpA-OmpF porin, OOP family